MASRVRQNARSTDFRCHVSSPVPSQNGRYACDGAPVGVHPPPL